MKRLWWGEDTGGGGRQRPTKRTLILAERRLAPRELERPA